MSFIQRFKSIFLSLEKAFMSEHQCIVCSKEIPDNTKFQICSDCYSNIKFISGHTCSKCGDALSIDTVMVCDNCKLFDYVFDHNTSCCFYEGSSAGIIKQLKYTGKRYFAKHIAEIMVEQSSAFKDIDIITYVPVSAKKMRKRGYNQAELIACEIGNILGLPVLKLVDKISDGKNQAKLNRKERIKNLVGTFEINLDNKSHIYGKNILVVDDVFTTGATLNEVSKVLKSAKPKLINTITFAKTELKSQNS